MPLIDSIHLTLPAFGGGVAQVSLTLEQAVELKEELNALFGDGVTERPMYPTPTKPDPWGPKTPIYQGPTCDPVIGDSTTETKAYNDVS